MRSLLLCLSLSGLAGCSGFLPPPPDGSYDPPTLAANMPRGTSGGVFTPATVLSLTSDNRAYRPGDVLTVVLEETTQASKKAGTNISKNSDTEVQPAVVFGKTYAKAEASMKAQRDFKGASSSTQQNELQGAITVLVQQVLPNGLLLVKGEKSLYLNQGEELLRLSGYVRVDDIDTNNRISSLRIANARIQYAGTGALADSNNPGWLTRFFNSQWMPF
ncbi:MULTISPECIES: flagellar basal body L-ring protein FlgH [Jeongeupia]|uniref:Flagellar L-ring protein n=2 Tax=Jeongeupia TaxID=885864 RepID=A0ABS2BHY9_9NEIS|nr:MULTISPECIES: flagellar basal body L-ring protein FlgH [Jeongeupia]MBM3114698.1 flagellar basal body L-ring protein FlgH [Jeongeupia naejangsanensis]GHD63426.1 flagellar L-ring protein 2 [Jeongeupia chitinilytica]